METLKWYLHGLKFGPRLIMAIVHGTQDDLDRLEADIDSYRETRPGK